MEDLFGYFLYLILSSLSHPRGRIRVLGEIIPQNRIFLKKLINAIILHHLKNSKRKRIKSSQRDVLKKLVNIIILKQDLINIKKVANNTNQFLILSLLSVMSIELTKLNKVMF